MVFKDAWLRSYAIAGNPGIGTESDPFDASTVDLFDTLMRKLFDEDGAPKYHIHLGTGTFLTNGLQVNVGTTECPLVKGWVMGNGWIVAGAGVDLTTLKLNEFTNPGSDDPDENHGARVVVFAVPDAFNDNLVVRDMTIDSNWPSLPQSPANGKCLVASVAMYSRGNATVENVRSINTYGDRRSSLEGFSIFLSHLIAFDETVPLDPPGLPDPQPRVTLAIRNCIAEQGHGDYVVGMVGFSRHMVDMRNNVCRDLPNGFPPGLHPAPFAGGANPSAAYQFIGRGITFTGNRSYNCPNPLYVDTGNIYDVLVANNQFFGCGYAGLSTNPGSTFFAIHVRKNAGALDGQYVDLPIKPSGGSDSYRVRVWFHLTGSSVPAPSNPGKLLQVDYLGGGTPDTTAQIDDKMKAVLKAESEGTTPLLANVQTLFYAVYGEPSSGAAWAGSNGTSVSDATALYAQRGWELQNWVIENNFFAIEYGYWTGAHPVQQRYGILLAGTGAPGCRDFTVTNNYVQFYGPITGSENFSYIAGGIAGHLSMIGNRTNYDGVAGFGQAAVISLLPDSTQYFFGNRINSGPSFGSPIPGLEDSDSGGKPFVGTLGSITEAGALLVNTTPALPGLQQSSPAVWWGGQGWKTTAGGASQSVEFRAYVVPVQGGGSPAGRWILESSLNDAGFGNQLVFTSDGVVQIGGVPVLSQTNTVSGITNKTFVAPVLGVATATSLNGLTISATTGTLTIPNGVVFTGPAVNGTAATLAGSETLTNKVISSANNVDAAAITTGNLAIGRIASALTTPGPIGGTTPGSGAFTTLTASNTVTLSPSGASVSLQPSGSGSVTIAPASVAGNINRMNLGATTPGTGAFTTLTASQTVTLSPSGGSVSISPTYGSVTISPNGGSVTIFPSMGSVTISTSGGYAASITPSGTLTLGAVGSSQTILAPGNNVVEQRNGTNAQTFRVYKTTDSPTSNYVRGIFGFVGTSGVFTIGTDSGGSGTAARLQFGVAKTTGGALTEIAYYDTTGHLLWNTDNTYDIGASGATRPRFVHVARTTVSGVASPAQITANEDNYSPGAQGKYLRLSTDANRNITGLTFTTTQVDGEEHLIVNVGTNAIVLMNESASSSAANRFHNTAGTAITLNADEQALCWYDGTTARWRVSKLN